MNKKIVSLVLAMCLCVGLGVSSLFADPYEKTGGTQWGNSGIDTSSNAGVNIGTFDVIIPDEHKAAVGDTDSKICAVFNYKSGMLLYSMDQDRNVTIYDAGRPRATLGYNDDGTFTVTNFYAYGSDWDKISQMEGSTDGEKFKNFLLSMGIQPSALKASSVDADGNVDTNKQVDVAWFELAAQQLKKGINYSVSVNLTANYGASMTWSVNGKPQETIGYDGAVLETYNYNAAGTLESVSQLTYKLEDLDADAGTGKYKKTTTTLYMDEYGKQSYATDTEGNVVTRYSYSSNGSLASIYSKENESTTYYSGGKASFVVNDQGFVTQRYFYHANGSLDGIMSYNYDEDTGAVKSTEITAYKWGRAVGTADLSSGTGVKNFDELREAIAEIKADPEKAKQSLIAGAQGQSEAKNTSKYSNITSIAIYESDITGPNGDALLRFLGISDQKAKMLAMSNGYSAVAQVQVTIDTIDFGTDTVGSTRKSMGTGSYNKVVGSETVEEGKVGEKISFKITIMDRGGASYTVNGAEYTLRDPVNAKVNQVVESDPAVEGTLISEDSENFKDVAISLGIMDEEGNILDEEAYENLKNGFYTDENGQTYAIVDASTINMMDGSGFQQAEGEIVLVAIDEATKESILGNTSGDRTIMFMGDVKENPSAVDGKPGYVTMAMNTNYGGGIVQGSKAVKEAKKEIWLISLGAAMDSGVDMTVISESLAAFNETYKDEGKTYTTDDAKKAFNDNSDSWVANNTKDNIIELLSDGFKFDQQNGRNKIEDAWLKLLF